ncbi:MAG: hypothetical protein HQK54_11630 [Oligoflexales bacterium]|nr:hypothetical protein [Oligoflexales bacterium]
MKMMDLWLAMFSSPEQEKFAPELLLSYGGINGTWTERTETAEKIAEDEGEYGSGQFWFTNLVSSTTKVRTLNVDLGVEGYIRNAKAKGVKSDAAPSKLQQLGYTSLNFRIFGRNIQDSSLILKGGKYESEFHGSYGKEISGVMAGAALTIYLFNWLGGDCNYQRFGDYQKLYSQSQQGEYYDYSLFIEVSLLRLGAGKSSETWQVKDDAGSQYDFDHLTKFVYAKLLF